MLYVKELDLGEADGQTIEKAIRNYSLKRHTSLDLQSSSTYMSEEKYFLGLESGNDIQITRLRTPFERLLPKLIIKFSKSDFRENKVRLGLFSMIVSILLVFSLLLETINSIRYMSFSSQILSGIILLGIFYLLTWMEYKLTCNKILKAIRNSG